MNGLYKEKHTRTKSGLYMNVFEPHVDMVCIEDIAHALSNICRFSGHCSEFYSVAQHSVMCSAMVGKEHRLEALLHDASEAYIMDMPSPIKKGLGEYVNIENELMQVIGYKFGFAWPMSNAVKLIDQFLLETEWKQLMLGERDDDSFQCWAPERAKQRFLEVYNEITKA